ncbi:MAG: DUF4105 domain-containing protein [Hyphomicrobiales bacterium]|nr:DUF4105 domain-containing protein [Hyphomicrobiales bacterium]
MNPYRSPFLVILAVLVVAILIAILRFDLMKPRADRNWEPEFARLTTFEDLGGGRWRLNNLRYWTWTESGPKETIWGGRIIDENAVTALWYYVQPFGGWDGIAHTFVVFELAGKDNGNPGGGAADYIGVSVEARREIGEAYSALSGLLRAYELSYLWASEKDLLTRRAVYLPEELYGYRLNVPPQTARAALRHFITRTNKLAAAPRFYNTLFSNCTNELAKTVNDGGGEDFIPYHYSFVLTGFADRYLHRLGYLGEPDSDFAAIRRAGHLNTTVRAIVRANVGASEKAFSQAVRAGLGAAATPGRRTSDDYPVTRR